MGAVPREVWVAALLLGVGAAALAIVWAGREEQAARTGPLPEATGDAGSVLVYAQLAQGPTQLLPDRPAHLPRPQDLAFQWTVRGTGPRNIRIDLESETSRLAGHQVRIEAPGELEPLEYVLHLDQSVPDELTLIVTIESPHTRALVTRYPLLLGAPSR